jgi:Cyclic nucleotide-binding domain/Acetyltransferase (GNAT) domain
VGLTVAPARSAEEREKVFAFRYQVYVEELKLSPPNADHARKRLWDPLDESSVSYAVFQDGAVAGSLRVTFLDDVLDPAPLIKKFSLEPAIAALGRSAICTTSRFILHPRLRHGLSILQLMETAYEDSIARRGEVRLNYGDCSPHLLPFYEHLGYRRYTRAYNDTAFGFKILLVMLLRDLQHFKQVRSPLLRVAARNPDDAEAHAWFAGAYPDYLDLESAAFMAPGLFFDLLQHRVATDPLHSLGLLYGLDRAEADRFLAKATLIKAEPGDRIVRQGEPGDAMFVLLSGIVEVTLDEAPDRPAAVLGAGDTFGEMSIVTSKPRTANVIAKTACEMIVLSAESLKHVIEKEPAIATKMLLNLSRILAERVAVLTPQVVRHQ